MFPRPYSVSPPHLPRTGWRHVTQNMGHFSLNATGISSCSTQLCVCWRPQAFHGTLIFPCGARAVFPQEHDLVILDGANRSLVGSRAPGLFPAIRAGRLLRRTENRYINNRGCVGIHACVLLEKVAQPFPRAQVSNLNPTEIYALAFSEKCLFFRHHLRRPVPDRRL